jgi:L-methionine (R)-S-oxide reductase
MDTPITDSAAALASVLTRFGAQAGTIHLIDPATGHLELAAAQGLPPHVVEIVRIVPIGKGMAGLAAERRAPVQTCNLQTDTSGDIRPGAKAIPVQGSIAVPIIVGESLRGVLGIAMATPHEWSEAESAALQAAGTAAFIS